MKKLFWKLRWWLVSRKKDKIKITAKDISEEQFSNIIKSIIKKMDFNKEDVVLDIGCADGELLKRISGDIKLGIGIDFISTMIKLGQKNTIGIKNLVFKKGDMRNLSIFRNNTFNKIILYSALHYLNNKNETFELFKQIKRICQKESLILIGDIPNEDIKTQNFVKNYVHLKYNKRELLNMISKLGGKGTIIKQDNSLPYHSERFDLLIRF